MYCVKCGKEITETETKQNNNLCNNCKKTIEETKKKSKLPLIALIVGLVVAVVVIIGMVATIVNNGTSKKSSQKSLEEIYAERLTLTDEMVKDIKKEADPYNNGNLCYSWEKFIIRGATARMEHERAGIATTTETKGVEEYTRCSVESMKQVNRCNYKIYGTLYGKDKFNKTTKQSYALTVYCKKNENKQKGYEILTDGFEL